MFVIRNLSLLPNRKVIVDVAQSNASPTADSYSPYHGIQTQFLKFIGHNIDTTGNIYGMLALKDDFDADKVKPKYNEEEYDGEDCRLENDGVPYDPAVHSLNHTYHRRLEDIASAYIEKYVENLAFSITQYDTGGIREYNRNHPTQPTLSSSGDDEDITELVDLQTFNPVRSYSSDVIMEAHKRLPFVLKRLHMLSSLCGVHMVTYVAAYYRAYVKNAEARLMKTTTAELKANRVIEEGVYLCDVRGEIKKKVEVKNRNQRALAMFEWITGQTEEWRCYVQDAYDFIHYCEVLSVDIIGEDFAKYPASFYENLVVLSVTPNSRYNSMVKNSLQQKSVSMPEVQETAPTDVVSYITKTFQEAILTNGTLRNWVNSFDNNSEKCVLNNYQSILMIYNMKFGKNHYRNTDFEYIGGLLHARGKLVQIPANWLCSWPDIVTSVVFHELGYVIVCKESSYLTVLHSNEALENAKKHLGQSTDLKVEWRKIFL